MKNINKNLIGLFAVFAFILTLSFASPARADFLEAGSGANLGSTISNSTTYNNYSTNPSPIIYSIDPGSAEACSGAKNISINGQNFVLGSTAKWNGNDRPTTYISSNKLIMQANSDDICSASGTYTITVYNPAPGGGSSNVASFTLTPSSVSNPTTVAYHTSKNTTVAKATNAKVQVACATGTTGDNANNSNLTANALFASNGFLPSNIFQWLLLFIIILLIVILTRKIIAKDKPLKHE